MLDNNYGTYYGMYNIYIYTYYITMMELIMLNV